MPQQEVTESWKDKIYEIQFTEKYIQTNDILQTAQEFPTIENIRRAFAAVKRSAYELIENAAYADTFTNKVKPELRKIDLILFGEPNNYETQLAMKDYEVKVLDDPRRHKIEIVNVQNVLNQLWDINRLTKQWAYKLGFFVRKPYDKKLGIEGIEEGMQQ